MSLSNGENPRLANARVIVGLGSAGPHETTVAEMEARRSPMHFEEVEATFWERVREKASLKAKDILSQAMAEAEEIKARAREEGYREGMAQSAGDYEAHVAELAKAVSETLSGVQTERKTLWQGYREDFTSLLKLAVEKTIGAELDARRVEIVKGLLDESLDLIDTRTNLTIRVEPEAAMLMEDLLRRAKESGVRLERWRVKPDPSLAAGGVILESADGMVDNSLATRWAEVESIFGRLAPGADQNGQGETAEAPEQAQEPAAAPEAGA